MANGPMVSQSVSTLRTGIETISGPRPPLFNGSRKETPSAWGSTAAPSPASVAASDGPTLGTGAVLASETVEASCALGLSAPDGFASGHSAGLNSACSVGTIAVALAGSSPLNKDGTARYRIPTNNDAPIPNGNSARNRDRSSTDGDDGTLDRAASAARSATLSTRTCGCGAGRVGLRRSSGSWRGDVAGGLGGTVTGFSATSALRTAFIISLASA